MFRSLGWGSHDGISVFIPGGEESQLAFSLPQLCEDTARIGATIASQEEGPHPEPNQAETLISDFKLVRNKCLFKPPNLWYLLWEPKLRHGP